MTYFELLEAVRNAPPLTDADIEAMAQRMEEREREYVAAAERRKVTTEMLNRVYDL